ncbi:hypothetical protein EDC01DRAFT_774945 [Geopyxis carbonaria]|nr:hypothetical protein EDC01DRAFT_774945 [Geopyxis carbonaria]
MAAITAVAATLVRGFAYPPPPPPSQPQPPYTPPPRALTTTAFLQIRSIIMPPKQTGTPTAECESAGPSTPLSNELQTSAAPELLSAAAIANAQNDMLERALYRLTEIQESADQKESQVRDFSDELYLHIFEQIKDDKATCTLIVYCPKTVLCEWIDKARKEMVQAEYVRDGYY